MLDYFDLEPAFTEAERAARNMVRELVESEVRPNLQSWQRDHAFIPDTLMPRLGAAQAFGPFLKGYGCPGLSHTAYGLIMQELERGDSGLRSIASVQGPLAMYAIHAYGSEEQRKAWLPRMARGEAMGSFALTERGHGSDPAGMETTARRDGDWYVLNGGKYWIGNGTTSAVRVVWARDEDGHVGGFLVERDAPGLHAEDIQGKQSLCLSRTSELVFKDCRIPAGNRLLGARGLRAALSCLSQARYGIAWGVLGAAMDCYDCALAYAKQREQFGKPIAGFQLIQEQLVWMLTEITKGQLVAFQLGRLMDAGMARPQQVSFAKRNNVGIALECARRARDILGAVGILDDHPVFRHMTNLETVNTYEGTHNVHTLILGQDITGINAFG